MSTVNSLALLHQQRGAATLIVAIILLLVLTLATFSAARIGITEQRSVANDIRAKEAYWVAQAGIEQGIAFLNANKALITSGSDPATPGPPPVEQGWQMAGATRWITCPNSGSVAITPPCGDGTTPHGPQWMSYNKGVFPITTPNLQQVSPEYTFDLDFLAMKVETINGFPAVNPTVIITATVSRTDGDPLGGPTGGNSIRVSQMVKGYDTLISLLNTPPFIDAPLMVAGSVNLGANISIWGNPVPNTVFNANPPNPDPLGTYPVIIGAAPPAVPTAITVGTPRPLSIWSRDFTALGVGAETCVPVTPVSPGIPIPSNYASPRLSYGSGGPGLNCNGPAGAPSVSDAEDYVFCVPHPPSFSTDPTCAARLTAWIANTPNATVPPFFPPDVFYYLFGIGNGNFQRVRNDATVLADCSTLGDQPSGFYWIDGNCTVTTNVGGTGGIAAAATAPITLVVNGGTFTLAAGVHFWGTVFLRGGPPGAQLVLPTTGVNPVLHGALISDQSLSVTTGNLDLVYDPSAFSTTSARAGGFAKVLGGWFDGAQ